MKKLNFLLQLCCLSILLTHVHSYAMEAKIYTKEPAIRKAIAAGEEAITRRSIELYKGGPAKERLKKQWVAQFGPWEKPVEEEEEVVEKERKPKKPKKPKTPTPPKPKPTREKEREKEKEKPTIPIAVGDVEAAQMAAHTARLRVIEAAEKVKRNDIYDYWNSCNR